MIFNIMMAEILAQDILIMIVIKFVIMIKTKFVRFGGRIGKKLFDVLNIPS